MRNAGRAVELVLFSLPLQRSGCAQHGNPAATPVCAHRNSPPFPDLTRRATPARTFMTHASYAATHRRLTSLACRVTVLPRRRYGRRRMTRGGNDGCEAAWRSWLETARSGGRCAHCGSRTLAPSGLERAAAFASPACGLCTRQPDFFFCEDKGTARLSTAVKNEADMSLSVFLSKSRGGATHRY